MTGSAPNIRAYLRDEYVRIGLMAAFVFASFLFVPILDGKAFYFGPEVGLLSFVVLGTSAAFVAAGVRRVRRGRFAD